jgi:gas vesicle protein
MRGLVQLMAGFVVGLTAGYVVSLLMAPDEGADTLSRVQSGAAALREAPRQVQARLQAAVKEGQRAAALTRADLESAASGRPTEPGPL